MRELWGRALVSALLLLVTACSAGSPGASSDGADPEFPVDVSPVPLTGAPGTVASSVRAPTSAAGQPRPASGPPPAPRACAAADLVASERRDSPPADRGPNEFVVKIVLTNTSPSACTLEGWPGLTVYGSNAIYTCPERTGCEPPDARSEPRTIRVTHSNRGTAAKVTLDQGASTLFAIVFEGNYGSTHCSSPSWPNGPYGGNIWVPGDSRSVSLVPFPNIMPCGNAVQVTAFGVDR